MMRGGSFEMTKENNWSLDLEKSRAEQRAVNVVCSAVESADEEIEFANVECDVQSDETDTLSLRC